MYISSPGLVQTQRCTFRVLAWYRHKNVLFLVADTCGEHLAWFFGITTPKYQYAIDEYYRLKEEVSKLHINTYFVENSRKKVYS
jgi:hypothetical protein